MPGVGGGARRSVLGVLSRLGVMQFGPSTSGGLPGRSLAPFGLWPPPTPRAPPRMTLLGAIWSCRRAQMGSMLPLEHGWVLGTSHGRGVPLKTPWWCQMLRYRRGLDGIRPASWSPCHSSFLCMLANSTHYHRSAESPTRDIGVDQLSVDEALGANIGSY